MHDALCGLKEIVLGQDWRWLLQPVVTILGTLVTLWIALSQHDRQKRVERKQFANAMSHVLEEALLRISDRLAIRFDPVLWSPTSGRQMRQSRANASINALADLKADALPFVLIPSFAVARGSLSALNEAMNAEKNWPPAADELDRYRTVLGAALEALLQLNKLARHRGYMTVEIPRLITTEALQKNTAGQAPG